VAESEELGLRRAARRLEYDREMPKAPTVSSFSLAIEYYREEDGRWLADIQALPGVTAYGRTKKQATAAVQALALRLIADRLEHGEAVPGPMDVTFVAASLPCCGSAGASRGKAARPTEYCDVPAGRTSCSPTMIG
jgi:predicted RNase H-like HicB family nuclease